MSNLRFEAVSEASKRKPVEVTAPSERPSEFFGKKVFNRQMRKMVFQQLLRQLSTIQIVRLVSPYTSTGVAFTLR